MIELDGVTVHRGGRCVVDDLSLRVERGSWVTMIGPNGAGKTSLLSAIAGLVPAEGRIAVDGAATARMRRRRAARLVALVPQAPLIPADMTVAEFVQLGRTPHAGFLGRGGAGDRGAVTAAVDSLALEALLGRRLGTLSGGEVQRAVLARALAQEAPVLLLDEPTAALDLGRQQDLFELLTRLHEERGLTVLAAMHDLTLACQYAERLALLDGGRLIAAGRPHEVLSEAAIARLYGATVRLAEIEGLGPVVVPVRRTAAGAAP
jgi:iron complex transport system ATP-binding protein